MSIPPHFVAGLPQGQAAVPLRNDGKFKATSRNKIKAVIADHLLFAALGEWVRLARRAGAEERW